MITAPGNLFPLCPISATISCFALVRALLCFAACQALLRNVTFLVNDIHAGARTRFVLIAAAASVLAQSFGIGGALGFRLVGRVEHSEILPPLSKNDELGKIFASTDLYKNMLSRGKLKGVHKFLVPAWLAGTWQREQATEMSRVELPSGKRLPPEGQGVAMVTDRFDSYRDALGLIWQMFDPAHASGEVDRGDAVDFHVVTDYQLIPLGRSMVVVEVQAAHAVVNKKTKKLISAYQDEELNTYSMISNDVIKTDSSVKVFDTQGRPRFLTRAVSTERRVAPFVDANKTDDEKS